MSPANHWYKIPSLEKFIWSWKTQQGLSSWVVGCIATVSQITRFQLLVDHIVDISTFGLLAIRVFQFCGWLVRKRSLQQPVANKSPACEVPWVPSCGVEGITPLHQASLQGDAEVARALATSAAVCCSFLHSQHCPQGFESIYSKEW